jgi:hypothetical protein
MAAPVLWLLVDMRGMSFARAVFGGVKGSGADEATEVAFG